MKDMRVFFVEFVPLLMIMLRKRGSSGAYSQRLPSQVSRSTAYVFFFATFLTSSALRCSLGHSKCVAQRAASAYTLSSARASSVLKHKQLHLGSSSLSCQINSANVPHTQKTGLEGLQHTRRSFCWNCALNGKFALAMSAKSGA